MDYRIVGLHFVIHSYNVFALMPSSSATIGLMPSPFIGRAEGAAIFCLRAFFGMKHRDGSPACGHSFRVARTVQERFPHDNDLIAIALLHDIVEDTAYSTEDLRTLFGDRIADAVVALSRGKSEGWNPYIKRVLKNKDSIHVKIADIEDNLSRMDSKMSSHEPVYSDTLSLLKNSLG